jgi:hypothetical protein
MLSKDRILRILACYICCFKKGQGAKAKDNTWGLQWADTVVMLCNKISNCIQDSTTAKGMVHEAQEAIYGKRRAIEVHAPTRWASNFKVVKSVWRKLSSKLCGQKSGAQLSRERPKPQQDAVQNTYNAVQNTYKMSRKAAEPLYFWEKVDFFPELITPVADAIHQVEADLPLMSQAWPMLQQLQIHFQPCIQMRMVSQTAC